MGQGALVKRRRQFGQSYSTEVAAVDITSRASCSGTRVSIEAPSGNDDSKDGCNAEARTTQLRCDRCGNVQRMLCGATNFTCSHCGAHVRVAVAAVARQAVAHLATHVGEAQREVQAVLEQQTLVCSRLWENMTDEVGLAEALWNSQMLEDAVGNDVDEGTHFGDSVREALTARNVTQVERVFEHLSEAGFKVTSLDLMQLLEKIRREEDLEVLWRCLLRALHDEDRLDLEFWCNEAASQQLYIPDEVRVSLEALKGAEHARWAEIEYQTTLQTRATEAYGRRDAGTLAALANEATLMGADPSAVEALRIALQHSPDKSQPSERTVNCPLDVGNKPNCQVADGGQHDKAPGREAGARQDSKLLADGVRSTKQDFDGLTIAMLKSELITRGLDITGVCEKEELVRLLAMARAGKLGEPEDTKETAQAGATLRAPKAHGNVDRVGFENRQASKLQAPPPQTSCHFGRTNGSTAGAQPGAASGPVGAGGIGSGRKKPEAGGSGITLLPRENALQCLGLMGKPTTQELNRAYKQAALHWHPDRRQNHDRAEEAKLCFQEIRAAFELLQREMSTNP